MSEGFSERGRDREWRDSRRGCIPASFPVFSCVLGSKSLIINEVSFSGNDAVLSGFSGWFSRMGVVIFDFVFMGCVVNLGFS